MQTTQTQQVTQGVRLGKTRKLVTLDDLKEALIYHNTNDPRGNWTAQAGGTFVTSGSSYNDTVRRLNDLIKRAEEGIN